MVHQGQTLWSIADRDYPNQDPRSVVEQLMSINHLKSPIIWPGERLKLPQQS